tara:strand:- start:1512 stop:2366 length:855 start_codon:yes stop_codon:yes gene_type:complete
MIWFSLTSNDRASAAGLASFSFLAMNSHYVFRFGASKLESDLEGVFLSKGGTLGGAAARSQTDFALSHSAKSTVSLLTEKHSQIDVPLSAALVASSLQLFKDETDGKPLNTVAEDVLLLSDRTQLLITSSRMGASINGTPAGTNSGGASIPLHTLFTTVDSSKLTSDAHLQGRLGYSPPPFQQIAIKYTNWEAINASVAVNAPQILRVDANGTEHAVSVAFFTPNRTNSTLKGVEPVLKSIYDYGWRMTEIVKFTPSPTLTKTVTRKHFGFNGSAYSLAAEVFG